MSELISRCGREHHPSRLFPPFFVSPYNGGSLANCVRTGRQFPPLFFPRFPLFRHPTLPILSATGFCVRLSLRGKSLCVDVRVRSDTISKLLVRNCLVLFLPFIPAALLYLSTLDRHYSRPRSFLPCPSFTDVSRFRRFPGTKLGFFSECFFSRVLYIIPKELTHPDFPSPPPSV